MLNTDIKQAVLDYSNGLLDLFFPPICVGCEENWVLRKHTFCLTCESELPRLIYHKNKTNEGYQRVSSIVDVESVVSFLSYEKQESLKGIIYAMKYGGRTDICYELGYMFGQQIANHVALDALIPVPLHHKKLKKRGYNQAEIIAQGIQKATNIPLVKDGLVRVKNTAAQARKSKNDRHKNVSNAFLNISPRQLDRMHIGIVDDVLTTGNTMIACANSIWEKSPNCKISFITVAIANR